MEDRLDIYQNLIQTQIEFIRELEKFCEENERKVPFIVIHSCEKQADEYVKSLSFWLKKVGKMKRGENE